MFFVIFGIVPFSIEKDKFNLTAQIIYFVSCLESITLLHSGSHEKHTTWNKRIKNTRIKGRWQIVLLSLQRNYLRKIFFNILCKNTPSSRRDTISYKVKRKSCSTIVFYIKFYYVKSYLCLLVERWIHTAFFVIVFNNPGHNSCWPGTLYKKSTFSLFTDKEICCNLI